jgi:hypothetical protein
MSVRVFLQVAVNKQPQGSFLYVGFSSPSMERHLAGICFAKPYSLQGF